MRPPHPSCTLLLRKVSIHAPWEGCDRVAESIKGFFLSFNSRTLGRVRHALQRDLTELLLVSIHAPWEGCDSPTRSDIAWRYSGFNSRTLGRVRPVLGVVVGLSHNVSIHAPWEGCDLPVNGNYPTEEAVSIHAPWEGCDRLDGESLVHINVSIHAPWEGCDGMVTVRPWRYSTVSIHAPWEGCDMERSPYTSYKILFQFTHPGKGATHLCTQPLDEQYRFNSRTLGRVRH